MSAGHVELDVGRQPAGALIRPGALGQRGFGGGEVGGQHRPQAVSSIIERPRRYRGHLRGKRRVLIDEQRLRHRQSGQVELLIQCVHRAGGRFHHRFSLVVGEWSARSGNHHVVDAHGAQQPAQAGGLSLHRILERIVERLGAHRTWPFKPVTHPGEQALGRGKAGSVGQLPGTQRKDVGVTQPQRPILALGRLRTQRAHHGQVVLLRQTPTAVRRSGHPGKRSHHHQCRRQHREHLAKSKVATGDVTLEGRQSSTDGQRQTEHRQHQQHLGRWQRGPDARLAHPSQHPADEGNGPTLSRQPEPPFTSHEDGERTGQMQPHQHHTETVGASVKPHQVTQRKGTARNARRSDDLPPLGPRHNKLHGPGQVERKGHDRAADRRGYDPLPAGQIGTIRQAHRRHHQCDQQDQKRSHRQHRGDCSGHHAKGDGGPQTAERSKLRTGKGHRTGGASQQADDPRKGGPQAKRTPAALGDGVVGHRGDHVRDHHQRTCLAARTAPGHPPGAQHARR